MVSSLILYLKLILPLLKTDSGSHEGQVQQHVNLIKGNPAANPSLKPPEQYLAVSQIASITRRLLQDPYFSTRASGMSKWQSVTTGSMPYFKSSSIRLS